MRRAIGFFVLLAMSSAGVTAAAAQADSGDAPDVAAIRAAGERTLRRLETETAAWTAMHSQGEREMRIDVIEAPGGRRVSTGGSGIGRGLYAVIERDGFWYVTEAGSPPTKCRPHEFPFKVAGFSLFRRRSELVVLSEVTAEELGRFESRDGATAVYRSPLPPAGRAQSKQVVESADALEARAPGKLPPQVKAQVEAMRDALARGLRAVVDLENGIALEYGTLQVATRIEKFRWLDAPPAGALTVEGRDWLDLTDGPLAAEGGSGELVMLLHAWSWRPGMPKQDMDGRLLDLKSGRVWRVPFPGFATIPGCFLKGRESVVVTGLDRDSSAFALYRVDLRDATVTPLGGDALASGMAGQAALSPDGRTLAVVHIPSLAAPQARQVYLVDVEAGGATPLGAPIDANAISWLPDGEGLILGRTDHPDDEKPWVGTVCRMGLEGKVAELFSGAHPTVLDARRLLYRDQADNLWKTRRFDGTDVSLFGDGLAGHGFPAPSPDGKRVLFMKLDPKTGPRPYVFNADGSGGKRATDMPGMWAGPAWR